MATPSHFTLIVIGENPDEIVKKYDKNNDTEPHILYYKDKSKKYRDNALKTYKSALENNSFGGSKKNYLEEIIEAISDMTDKEYFEFLAQDNAYDDNGNIISTDNINGKFDICRIGKNLSLPLINKAGEEVFSEIKGNVDWDKIHLANPKAYEVAWDTVMEGKKPTNKDEETIYNNMKHRTQYFMAYGDRETYIKANTAFWGYAVVDQNGWKELEDKDDQFDWVINFFDRFIENLPDDTRISVYECARY